MKITVTFDSLEEFQECMRLPGTIIKEGTSGPQTATKKPETKNSTPKAEKPAEKPEEVSEETKAPAEEKADADALRVEVRKLLTKVNKQTGKNQAREWIKNLGHDSLTEVKELDDLKALKALAEEELDA
jgi:hypothetical protein